MTEAVENLFSKTLTKKEIKERGWSEVLIKEKFGWAIDKVAEALKTNEKEASTIVEKAILGGESTPAGLGVWFVEHFLPNIVYIDEEGYSKMCIDALKITGTTASSDYGSSRQRDMGQHWADMTRGYLGELAFQIFLEKKYGLKVGLGHEQGTVEEYVEADIHDVQAPDGTSRKPNIKIGIKTTKWNGIWLDLPNDTFNHSDVHVLVKVGTGKDHLFAFFKKLSVFKDKILQRGKDIGLLSEIEADALYDSLPTFHDIPAYICGFALKSDSYTNLEYSGKKGISNFEIRTWRGPIEPGNLDLVKEREQAKKVSFRSIGSFAHDRGYLFNTGSLHWESHDWNRIIEKI